MDNFFLIRKLLEKHPCIFCISENSKISIPRSKMIDCAENADPLHFNDLEERDLILFLVQPPCNGAKKPGILSSVCSFNLERRPYDRFSLISSKTINIFSLSFSPVNYLHPTYELLFINKCVIFCKQFHSRHILVISSL